MIEMSTVIAEVKKMPTITPASSSVWIEQPARHDGDHVDGARRQRARPANANVATPSAWSNDSCEPEDLGQHHAEGRAARHAEHRGLGQRIAREALEGDAGHGQRAAGQHRRHHARQAQLQRHDRLDRLGAGPPGQRARHRARREPARCPRTARPRRPTSSTAASMPRASVRRRAGAHRNASGWMKRASVSMPSGTRGP